MRFAHISDLHIGKRVHGFSMIEDQRYIFEQIIQIIKEENVEGLLIAGDVYDKNVPTEEAVDLLDDFLTEVSCFGCPIYMIAGNHDSAERLSFGNRIMKKNGVHITDKFSGRMEHVECQDEHGNLNIFLLPYIKPSLVQPHFSERISEPDEAFEIVLNATGVDPSKRNILLSHQFIVGSGIDLETTDSEERRPTVGGLDCISAYLMDPFDYVALGHIHRPQTAGRQTVRYCGSPVKYSLSEINDTKSVTIIDVKRKGTIDVQTIPLVPKREMRQIRGTLRELLSKDLLPGKLSEDYIFATLTEQAMDAMARLSAKYPNIMDVRVEDGTVTSDLDPTVKIDEIKSKNPYELFEEFFKKINGKPLSKRQTELLGSAVERSMEEALR